MHISVLGLRVVVTSGIDDESVICMNISVTVSPRFKSTSSRHQPRLVYRVIPTAQTPARIYSPSSPRPIEVVAMELVLVWPWWERKVHEMGNRSLTLSPVRILHAEQFSLCILIQRPKLLALLMLRLAALLVPRCRARSRVSTRTTTPSLSAVVGEWLSLRTRWTAGTRGSGGFRGRGYRLGGDQRQLTRHDDAKTEWGGCPAQVCSEAVAELRCLAKGRCIQCWKMT
jgi:hypothetical protein